MRCSQYPSSAPAVPICYVPTEPTRPETLSAGMAWKRSVGHLVRTGSPVWLSPAADSWPAPWPALWVSGPQDPGRHAGHTPGPGHGHNRSLRAHRPYPPTILSRQADCSQAGRQPRCQPIEAISRDRRRTRTHSARAATGLDVQKGCPDTEQVSAKLRKLLLPRKWLVTGSG